MIVLTSTDKLQLQVYQDNTLIEVHVSYIDWLGSIATPGSHNTNITLNTNQTVDILSAPVSGVIRAVEYISIYNPNGFAVNFNIFHFDNVSNPYICIGAPTEPNGLHIYTTYSGWQAFTGTSGVREGQPANSNPTASNPTGVTVNAWRHLGLGSSFQFILRNSPNTLVEVSCVMFNNTNNAQCYLSLIYGTGTPPTNGQVFTGTSFGSTYFIINNANYVIPHAMVLQGILTGLTMGTLYWVDVICQSPTAVGTANLQYPNCVLMEI
jgi:hypothetical protein